MLVTAIWTGLQTRLGAAWWIRDFFRWLFEKASCPSKPWKSAWTMSVHHWSLGERLSSLNIGAATANHVLATSCNRSLSLSIATIYHTAILKDSSNLFIGAGMSRISSGTTRALEEQEAMRKLFFSDNTFSMNCLQQQSKHVKTYVVTPNEVKGCIWTQRS